MKTHDPLVTIDGLDELAFKELERFNSGAIGVYRASGGTSRWERHPDTDELVYILDGEAEIEIATGSGTTVRTLVRGGSLIVVPRGLWHRHVLRGPVKELYVIPGSSEHADELPPA